MIQMDLKLLTKTGPEDLKMGMKDLKMWMKDPRMDTGSEDEDKDIEDAKKERLASTIDHDAQQRYGHHGCLTKRRTSVSTCRDFMTVSGDDLQLDLQ